MGNAIVSFEDFQKKAKSGLKEDTIMPTGNSTVFVDDEEGSEDHHSNEEKNYMFFKNLHTMKKCIEEIMAMDKEQVDEMIERGHDWASDHISSSKDDLQEVCDWLRYEIDTYDGEEEDDDQGLVTIDVDGDDEIEADDDDDDDDDDESDDVDDESDDDEEEEEALESKEPKYSYTEEKN